MQAKRRKYILDLLMEHHGVSVTELCERLNVSEMTIRRDLRALELEGLLRRTHGGAVSNLGRSYEPLLRVRAEENTDQKASIGKKAAEMVEDGHSIALDVGTTTLEIARALRDKHNLTIITASLPIALEIVSNFSMESDVRLILTGGIVRPGELSMVGEIARHTYATLHVDIAFIGAGGISPAVGITEFNLDDTQIKQELLRTAQRKVLVADSSKFGRTTFATIAPLSAIDTIVTDTGITPEMLKTLHDRHIRVILAE
ncbi:DeoR/GlpR family DNA-binding transcription regulator [Aggregatilinea lenta]|uniref:DeoR/GlpR family DNA-binding transcription regulator n=1 Tax=Aggregatilinea lenta TaxID=913108 RepID=UPI000E5A70CE|nr:DeoR/GlpR family DNA-binding transcription regulator [Aggregatilinea lenta]